MMATLHVKSNLQCCHASPNCAAIKPERLLGEQKLLWLLPCEVALAKADPHISTLKTVAKDKSLVQGPSPRALPVTQKLDPRPRSKSFLSGSVLTACLPCAQFDICCLLFGTHILPPRSQGCWRRGALRISRLITVTYLPHDIVMKPSLILSIGCVDKLLDQIL